MLKFPRTALFVLLFLSLNSCESDNPILSGNYWLKTDRKQIASRATHYYNSIYPIVTSYAYSQDFIVAEQKPDLNDILVSLGDDLLGRFNNYALYRKDSNLLDDPFYTPLRGFVEKDSVLYNQFLLAGASKDESINRNISIRLAENMIDDDRRFKKIVSSRLNYWIIYLPKDTLIGPLTQEEYLVAKARLGIPKDVELDFEK